MKTKFYLIGILLILLTFYSEKIYCQKFSDMVALDFTETQFTFYDPMDCSQATFLFKVTNVSNHNLEIYTDLINFKNETIPTSANPQGSTLLAPNESMWCRTIFKTRLFNYDYKIKQDIKKTVIINMHDWLNQYDGDDSRLAIEKEITIKVAGGETSTLCEAPIKLTVIDELGKPVDAAVEVDGPSREIGNEGIKRYVMNTGLSGKFVGFVPVSARYHLFARKNGYMTVYKEISAAELTTGVTIQLQKKDSKELPSFTLKKTFKGDIGFWRGSVNKQGDKIFLVQGMENYYDNNLYNDGKAILFDVNTEEILWQYPVGWQSWSGDIDDAGKYAVVTSYYYGGSPGFPSTGFNNYIALLNQKTGQEIWKKDFTKDNFPVIGNVICPSRGLKLSHSGNNVFVSNDYGASYLLNSTDGSIKWEFDYWENIREIIFSDDDQYLYVSTGGGWVYKFNTADGSVIWKQWVWSWASVNGFEISKDKKYLAIGANGGGAAVMDCETGSLIYSLPEIDNGSSWIRWINTQNDLLVSGGSGLSKIYDIKGNRINTCDALGIGMDWRPLDNNLLLCNNGELFDLRDGENLGRMFHVGEDDHISHFGWYNSVKKKYVWAIMETRSRNENILEVFNVDINTGTDSKNNLQIPSSFEVFQNYPNPFNPSTTIKYSVPQAAIVKVSVYDILGREILNLVNEEKLPGNYEVKFDGANLSSGIYFYRMQAGEYMIVKKMSLIK